MGHLNKIDYLLNIRKISKKELSEILHISRQHVYELLKGSSILNLHQLFEIAMYLHKTPAWFLIEELGPDEDIDDLLANREANITSEKTALAKRIHDLEARLKEEKALHEWTQKECRHANEKLDVKDELIETLFKRIEDLTGEKRKTKTA